MTSQSQAPIEGIRPGMAKFLLVFNDGEYQSINLNGWLASSPSSVVANNMDISEQLVDQLPRRNQDFDR